MNESSSSAASQSFRFTGKGSEYFRIWIVNLVLGILTLGIYSAWAKVRTNRYFFGNTQLDGSGFEYHASPITLLKGRLIAIALLLLFIVVQQVFPLLGMVMASLLMLAAPWIMWRSILFNARMTSYRNVRFGFTGALQEAYRYLLLYPLLPLLIAALAGAGLWLTTGGIEPRVVMALVMVAVLTTYLLLPLLQKTVTAYIINNYRYGQGRLHADLSAGTYYRIYLCMIGWSILIFVGVLLAMGIATYFTGMDVKALSQQPQGQLPPGALTPLLAVVGILYLGMLLGGAWLKAYVKSRIRNHIFSHMRLDDVLLLESGITTGRLFSLYVVNMLLLVGTVGLAWPWVKIRVAQLMADTTHVQLHGSLDQYVGAQQSSTSALGEEIGDAFDVGVNLDLAF